MKRTKGSQEGGLARNMLSEAAYDALKDQIINLELPPGTRLNLDRLAEEFRVSQTPLREALTRLMGENLVCMEPFKGFSVEPLLEDEEVLNLLEVRTLLETHAATKAAVKMRENDLSIMRRQVEVMDGLVGEEPLNVRAFNAADANFHLQFVLAADNPILAQSYAALNVHVRIARLFQNQGLKLGRQANKEHRHILEAFDRENASMAAERVQEHIKAMHDRLRNVGEGKLTEDTA